MLKAISTSASTPTYHSVNRALTDSNIFSFRLQKSERNLRRAESETALHRARRQSCVEGAAHRLLSDSRKGQSSRPRRALQSQRVRARGSRCAQNIRAARTL